MDKTLKAIERATPASQDPSGEGSFVPLITDPSGRLWVNPAPGATTLSAGLSVLRSTDLDEVAVAVKASAGNLYGIHIINRNAAAVYVHFYDVAQGSVTVGTTTPKVTFLVPATGGLDKEFNLPIDFGTAITVACTLNPEADATDPGATTVISNIFYK